MRQVIADVPKNPPAEDGSGSVPVVTEKKVGQAVKRGGKGNEQRWWHDQSKLVHWQIVMYTMEQEVKRNANAIVREISDDISVSVDPNRLVVIY